MNSRLPLQISSKVGRILKKIKKNEPQLYKKIVIALEQIREEPLAGESKVGDLKGIFSLDIKHIGTNYELAYKLEKKDTGEYVLVIMFGTRENFYKELKRYLK